MSITGADTPEGAVAEGLGILSLSNSGPEEPLAPGASSM